MTAFPLGGSTPYLAYRLLAGGVPLTLLLDLLDPEGMRVGLASELLVQDVALAPCPPVRRKQARTA